MSVKDHHYVFAIMALAMVAITANVAALFVTDTVSDRVTLMAVINGFALSIVGWIMILAKQDKSDRKQDMAARQINGRMEQLMSLHAQRAFAAGLRAGNEECDEQEIAGQVLKELRKSVPPEVLKELQKQLGGSQDLSESKQQGSKDLADPDHNIGVPRQSLAAPPAPPTSADRTCRSEGPYRDPPPSEYPYNRES